VLVQDGPPLRMVPKVISATASRAHTVALSHAFRPPAFSHKKNVAPRITDTVRRIQFHITSRVGGSGSVSQSKRLTDANSNSDQRATTRDND
jgi:hypothetical protein